MAIFICDAKSKRCLPDAPFLSLLSWKIRARSRANVQNLSSVQHLASLACVSGCNPLLCFYIQDCTWSLHLESVWLAATGLLETHGY